MKNKSKNSVLTELMIFTTVVVIVGLGVIAMISTKNIAPLFACLVVGCLILIWRD